MTASAPKPRHRAEVRPSTPFDPLLRSVGDASRMTAVLVASSGLVAASAALPAGAASSAVGEHSASSSAFGLVGSASIASVPLSADWSLDVPAITVDAGPQSAPKAAKKAAKKTVKKAADDTVAQADAPDETPPPEVPEAPAKTEEPAKKATEPPKRNAKSSSLSMADDIKFVAGDDEDEPSTTSKKAAEKDADKDKDSAPKAKDAKKDAKDSKDSKDDKDSSKKKNPAAASFAGKAVLEVAERYIGAPYVYGGTSPRGFDCSGFTQYVYAQLGINLPHQSGAQPSRGRVVSRSDARPGDLIHTPGHVAIYAGGNRMIDSARTGTTVQYRNMWQRNPTFIRLID